jgi:hypothetical protein
VRSSRVVVVGVVAVTLAAVITVALTVFAQQRVPVTASSVSGEWQQPGEPFVGHPTRTVLYLGPDGRGSLSSAALGVSMGMGMSWGFDYTTDGSLVTLHFQDGVAESLAVTSLTRSALGVRAARESTRTPGGVWQRRRWW